MKIMFDVQCCQTEAQERGMGRYSLSLLEAVIKAAPQHEFLFLLNGKYLGQSYTLLQRIEDLGLSDGIVYYDYPNLEVSREERNRRELLGNILRNFRISACSPDVIHFSSIFEGESVYGRALNYLPLRRDEEIIHSATIYDFVPSLMPDHYVGSSQYSQWYAQTVNFARSLDIGLCISDATLVDAQRFLRPAKPHLVNILGSVDPVFRKLPNSYNYSAEIWNQTDLKPYQYIIYVGGPDYRKNVEGAIRGFAHASAKVRQNFTLVIVFNIGDADRRRLERLADSLNVRDSVLFTGFVSDDVLVELYNRAALFLFPSLYEGLGMPVIEAMRCGTPVLVADNSSLVELVPHPDQRFDPEDAAGLGALLSRKLESSDTLNLMRKSSELQARKFTWHNSARRAIDTWEELFDIKKSQQRTAVSFSRRKRYAIFTPLPEARTGIADYSVDIIQILNSVADIDIYVDDLFYVRDDLFCWSVKHHTEFLIHAAHYDAVIYQIGNSPFHHYMRPYIHSHPGIMIVHDAYLGHLYHDPENTIPFALRALEDHGGRARQLFDQLGIIEGAREVIRFCTNTGILCHAALGVVVHSEHARTLLLANCQRAVAPEIAVVDQYIDVQRPLPTKAEARQRLGISTDAFIVASFGHVAHTKGILEAVQGFLESEISKDPANKLIFVGELEGGPNGTTPYAQQVRSMVGSDKRIEITGFVDKAIYVDYLSAADMVIQLRTLTRGETSRAILDALAAGKPLVFNPLGSAKELPDAVGWRTADHTSSEVCRAFNLLYEDGALRATLGQNARSFMAASRDPQTYASALLHIIDRMSIRGTSVSLKALASEVKDIINVAPNPAETASEVAKAYIFQSQAGAARRLLIDVTHIQQHDLKTGVQRVVREITNEAFRATNTSLQPTCFSFAESELFYADEYALRIGAKLEVERANARYGSLKLRPFDKMLLADGSWHLSRWMEQPIKELNSIGGEVYGLVHDILPLTHPDFFHDHVRSALVDWLSLLTRYSAGLICTTETGADELIKVLRSKSFSFDIRSGLRVSVAKLGADFRQETSTSGVEVRPMVIQRKNGYALIVGTIEPRKGHSDVIDAFDRLWKNGSSAELVIAGKMGWNIDSLSERINSHPLLNKKLFYLGQVSDNELTYLYNNAGCVVVASLAEGFGLPVYEGLKAGRPMVLRDISVFRELAGDYARYFSDLPESLDNAIEQSMQSNPSQEYAKILPTWKQATTDILAAVQGRSAYYTFT